MACVKYWPYSIITFGVNFQSHLIPKLDNPKMNLNINVCLCDTIIICKITYHKKY